MASGGYLKETHLTLASKTDAKEEKEKVLEAKRSIIGLLLESRNEGMRVRMEKGEKLRAGFAMAI